MDKRGLAVSVIIIIWVFLPSTHQYKSGCINLCFLKNLVAKLSKILHKL